jgi:hypothetical protein
MPRFQAALAICLFGFSLLASAREARAEPDEEIAVLDFDGYGVNWTDTQSAADGLRAALLSGGQLRPLTGAEISRRMLGDRQDQLNLARQLMADARLRLDADEREEALALLAEALGLHDSLGSGVCRRPEVADVFGWSAITMAELGWEAESLAYMIEALALYPRWQQDRASGLSTEVLASFVDANHVLLASPRRVVPAIGLQAAIDILATPRLVLGRLELDGSLVLQVFDGTTHRGELAARAQSLPLTQSDPVFHDLARRLERLFPTAATPEIQERKRWWVWPLVLGTTAGGGALIAATLVTPPPIYEVVPPSWSVTVD